MQENRDSRSDEPLMIRHNLPSSRTEILPNIRPKPRPCGENESPNARDDSAGDTPDEILEKASGSESGKSDREGQTGGGGVRTISASRPDSIDENKDSCGILAVPRSRGRPAEDDGVVKPDTSNLSPESKQHV